MANSSTCVGLVSPVAVGITPIAVFIAFIALQSLADERLPSMGLDARRLYPALWLPIISHTTTNAVLAWWILAIGIRQFR